MRWQSAISRTSFAQVTETITIGAHEKYLVTGRERQHDPVWKADYRATRPKVERKIGHLMRRRHGGRRARMRGRDKIGADFGLLAALRSTSLAWQSSDAPTPPAAGPPSPSDRQRPPKRETGRYQITTSATRNNSQPLRSSTSRRPLCGSGDLARPAQGAIRHQTPTRPRFRSDVSWCAPLRGAHQRSD
ncbi:transposase [Nocardia sp. GAS34]|uniref:transposase n=1 Tax=unclassified Nocardia TaxID=2637762 RepID=UPI003D1D1E6C